MKKPSKDKVQRARSGSGNRLAAETLAIEEWSFSSVPAEKIDTCFYYEYARERDDVRKLVNYWREQLKDLDRACDLVNTREARRERGWWDSTFENEEAATKAFWRALAELTDWTFAQMLINLPEFPDTPWQKFDPSRRKKWGH